MRQNVINNRENFEKMRPECKKSIKMRGIVQKILLLFERFCYNKIRHMPIMLNGGCQEQCGKYLQLSK